MRRKRFKDRVSVPYVVYQSHHNAIWAWLEEHVGKILHEGNPHGLWTGGFRRDEFNVEFYEFTFQDRGKAILFKLTWG